MNGKHAFKSINAAFINEGAAGIGDDDVRRVVEKEEDIKRKVFGSGLLQRFCEDVALLFSMVRDYWNGLYREFPWWVVASVVFALLYVLNPFDLIPDILPVIGLTDDAAVLALCLAMTEKDILKYRDWKGLECTGD